VGLCRVFSPAVADGLELQPAGNVEAGLFVDAYLFLNVKLMLFLAEVLVDCEVGVGI